MGKISNFIKKATYQFKTKKNLDKIILEKKNLDDLFNYFESDKGSVILKKYPGHEYGRFYEKHLSKYRNENLNILEIGTYYGGSVAAFYFYFKNANIFCIDKNFKFKFKSSRVKFFNCDTSNESDLSSFKEFIKKENCKKFDLIIDDGLHSQFTNLNTLIFALENLNKDGYLVIEDIPEYALDTWKVVANIIPTNFSFLLVKTKAAFVGLLKKEN